MTFKESRFQNAPVDVTPFQGSSPTRRFKIGSKEDIVTVHDVLAFFVFADKS
jgi:hypothetical protein